ncbi:peptidase S8/S53 domain-containing protein [Rhodofomes roseus]|uniref:Peptidase S8/S53 domain-containing protein n=1 Tax=Rhodofomes roseus TaxID=34475 RepID=A0ABQ8K865_9APHY|nr:peptidase S8/S53 domain-containing protein [Rhodofomes roseus]KAH9833454.1 peptidase S8/S53 domain-containing protein [Rhodofomes roseus]
MLLAARLASSFALIFTLSLIASGAPANSRTVVHESRNHVPRGWNAIRRADPGLILPFRIGLAQPNIENIEAYLLDVSHPSSPNYGKHWAPGRIAETFRPSRESIDTVRAWLAEAGGLDAARVNLSAGGGWLQADLTVEEAERLLETEYHVYQFEGDEERTHVACHEKYHLPEDVAKHVEIVTPTLHFDVKPKSKPVQLEKRDAPSSGSAAAHAVGQPGFGASFPKTSGTIQPVVDPALAYCDEQIVPDCLRVLYSFDYTPVAPERNSIAIVEYTPEAYVATDLDMFFANYSPAQIGERPVLNSIDGGFVQTNQTGFDYNGESNLDLQYAMTLVGRTQPVQLYQAGDDVEGASFNNLLDALDGSYCYFEGGDNPEYDSIYPDPYGGYEGPESCGTVTPAYVMSTSYSYNEADLTPAYEERQCAEYAKLGLMGVTVLYSSGDYGVAGNDGVCLYPNGTQADGAPDFNPSFPGTCPYITSVGATQVNPNSTVYEPESACEQVIYSGGGFSNVFPMPSYQKTAVEYYLTNYPPPYAPTLYNSSGTSRGFPDIAANGANYVVAIDGEFWLVYGTSCSSPVSAAIFSGINDARLAVGKGPIGFINPTIYTPAFMAAFNDITTGSNQGCDTEGFYAQPGWDPVTGVGTPNFSKLVELWLDLP